MKCENNFKPSLIYYREEVDNYENNMFCHPIKVYFPIWRKVSLFESKIKWIRYVHPQIPGMWKYFLVFSSVESLSVSDSLWSHELQHARPPCLSPTPGVYPNSCPLSKWCHPTISSSVIHFSSRPQSFPASGSFQMSQLFASGGQSIGVSSFSISPSNEYSGLISFRMDWLDLLAVQGTLKSLLQHHSSKHQFFRDQLSLYSPTLTSIDDYWKNHSLD